MAEPQKSKVKVIVRIRPFLSHEPKQRCVYVDAKNSKILELVYSSKTEAVRYSFDRCFDVDAKQASIFDEEIEPVLKPLMRGINTSIFCYGMTGAGKTHTMQGTAAEPGIIPRSVETVLKMIQSIEEQDKKAKSQALPYTVSVSYYEIYNEKLFDLLEAKEADLPIREDMNKNIVIPGLADVPIKDFKHFETLYEQGCRNRSVGPTKLNNQSSRSHAILTIKVQRVDGNKKIAGKLHLIDLAGSEDNRRTDNTGVRMTESTNINTSLFVLGKVVTALNDQQKRIPYRDSKLTRLLQDSLGGNSYSVMIANVAPGLAHYNNTQNALNFAAKSRLIVNNPTINVQEEVRPPPVEVKIKETKPVATAAPVVNTQVINEAEKKFAEITKRLEKLEKEKQVKLVGHVLRDKGILDAADQERLELLEHEVVTQYKKKRKEEQIASVHNEGYAKMPLYTPATKKRKVLSKIVKAKEFDERGLDTAALEYYRIARSMLAPEEITDKLDRRIKELEGKVKPVATKNKENMPNFNELLEQAADSKVGSKRKLSHSESDDENPKKKRRSSSKDFEAMKRNIRNQLPSLTDDKIQTVLSRVLNVLNQGDIKAIQELETIGKKRAQDIINYRVEQKIKNVEQLVECGFGEGMVVNFVKRNIFETLYLSAK